MAPTLIAERVTAFRSESVTIIAGTDETKEYTMPKGILMQGSEWFKAALQGDRWREGSTLVVRLPESPRAVEALLYFIHTLRLDYGNEGDMKPEEMQEELHVAFEVWMAGQKYLLPRLQDTAMSRICALISKLDHGIPCECLAKCFKLAEGTRALQRIVADYVVDQLNRKKLVVSPELAACDGIIAAIHESETAFHKSSDDYPQSFPRYKKPCLFEDVLGCALPEGFQNDKEKGITRYGTLWDRLSLCEECGQDVELVSGHCAGCDGELRCKNCGTIDVAKTLCFDCSGHRMEAEF